MWLSSISVSGIDINVILCCSVLLYFLRFYISRNWNCKYTSKNKYVETWINRLSWKNTSQHCHFAWTMMASGDDMRSSHFLLSNTQKTLLKYALLMLDDQRMVWSNPIRATTVYIRKKSKAILAEGNKCTWA